MEHDKKIPDLNSSEKPNLGNLPPEIEGALFSVQSFIGSAPHPLLNKINEKHIDKILEIAQKEEDNSFKDAQSTKIFGFFYFLIFITFLIFIIYFLSDKDKVLLQSIIEKLILLLSGFAGGYGFKSYIDNRSKK